MKSLIPAVAVCCLIISGATGCASRHQQSPADLQPDIIPASAWDSTPEDMTGLEHEPRQITLHHAGVVWTEDKEPLASARGLQSWGARERGWPDVPYHFFVAPDGEILEGRDVRYQPETNTNYDVAGHIGINVWGNYEEQRIRAEQLAAVVDLCAWLCAEHQLDPAEISGHLDVAPGQTVCPGSDLYRYIDGGLIQDWTAEKLAGEEPAIAVLPPAEGGPTEFVPYGQ